MSKILLNGVEFEKYTVVSDSFEAVARFCNRAFEKFGVRLLAVSTDMCGGENVIKIGAFGACGYEGRRFKVTAEGGVITIDGETSALQLAAIDFFFDRVLVGEGSEFIIDRAINGSFWVDGGKNTGLVFSEKTVDREIARGVRYMEKKYINNEGKNNNVFFTAISGDSETEFRVWAGDLSPLGAKRQMTVKTVTEQAVDFEAAKGEEVVMAVNASYFRMFDGGSNYPYGLRVLDGEILCEPMIILDWKPGMRPDFWIGLTYDGKLVRGNKETYEKEYRGKIRYGVATGTHMMQDGKIVFGRESKGVDPLTAIALTEDGGYIIVCVDGRTEESLGCSLSDIVDLFLDLAEDIPDVKFRDIYVLDGGGSTEMILKEGGEFVTKNVPSTFVDGVSVSRPVGDIIAAVIPKK